VLTRRQARWAEHLAEFNFKVVYRPGDKNTKADVLSRRWDHAPEGGSETAPEVSFFKPGQYVDEESRKGSESRETRRNTPNIASISSRATREGPKGHEKETRGTRDACASSVRGILDESGVVLMSAISIAGAQQIELKANILDLIREAGKKDPDWLSTKGAALKRQNGVDGPVVAEEFEVKDGLLFYENRWVIPNDSALKLRILQENHDSKVAGHFGQFKTIERTKQNFFWNKMEDDVRDYVRSCDTCQRDKTSRHKRYGLLQPLDISYRPWTSISMDFITALPESDDYSQIWVIVDRLTKMTDGQTERPETQWIRPPESQFTNPASELLIARWQGIWSHLQENTHDAQQRIAK
jgi:hypothetical protein